MAKLYLSSILLLLSFFIFIPKGYGANITVGGAISSNTSWSADTVKITSDVTINNGVTLTIAAGTYVQIQGQYKIDVKGRLLAIGSATQKIQFSPLSTTVGWKGVRFDNTSSVNDSSRIVYCIFTGGRAVGPTSANDKSGGAIFMYNFSKLEISNSIFSNNYASYYGGAIALEYKASPLIINCLIVNNTAASTGGGIDIYNHSDPKIINSTIAYNSSSNGGGIWVGSSSPEISNSIFSGNSASNSSQIYGNVNSLSYCLVEGGASGTQIFDTVPNFVSPPAGAGNSYDGLAADFSLSASSYLRDKGSNSALSSYQNKFDVIGKFRFDNNRTDIGAYEYISSLEACGSITSNTTWSGNVLLTCNVTVDNGKTLTIAPGTKVVATGPYYIDVDGQLLAQGTYDDYISLTAWDENEGWLGLIFSSVSTSNDSSKIEYCKISNKVNTGSASPYYYGAIYVSNCSKLLIRSNMIFNNHSKYGAGITLINSSAPIVNNLIVNNQVNYYGGAIYISGSGSSPLIINNSIVKNRSLNYSTAYAVYRSSGSPILRNNIIYYNTDNSGNHSATDNASTGMDMQFSLVEGGYTGTGNINNDPLFKKISNILGKGIDIENVSFQLQTGSPCIDAGSSVTTGQRLPAVDLSGKTRVYSTGIDMGAYEDKSSLSVCGSISANTVWDANVINITCDVSIPSGVTVTIPAGIRVLFNGHYKIEVAGAIQALGNEGDSIIFTASDTATGWDGILFDNVSENVNDSSIFQYCVFESAKRTPTSSYLTGSAIANRSSLEFRINDCRFSNNVSSGSYGYGALSFYSFYSSSNQVYKFHRNMFSHNLGKYGIVYFSSGSGINFTKNVLYDNRVTHGGIIRINYLEGQFDKNHISNNASSYGSIYNTYTASYGITTFSDNIIVNNQGVQTGGIYLNGISPEFTNNTIANNYATSSLGAGAFYFNTDADAILKNNIVYGNEIVGGLPIQVRLHSVTADPKMYNNDIEGGKLAFTGDGAALNYSGVYKDNMDASAGFTSASAGVGVSYNGYTADWTLAQGSQLINAGYKSTSSSNSGLTDFAYNPRVFNGRVDIGAFENQDAIVAPCSITSDTEWEADTIFVNCNVTISTGTKLTIKPATTVVFSDFYGLQVDGTIEAEGTPSHPIVFTVADTNGFYDLTLSNGGWDGINFNSVSPLNDSSIFSHCIFKYGKAFSTVSDEKNGGAVNIYNTSKISIQNCIFSNNQALNYGGAIYLESGDILFCNNIVVNNFARDGYGGGMYLWDFSGKFSNNTIANNKGKYTGGVYFKSGESQINNNIFWGNIAYSYSSNSYGQLFFTNGYMNSMYNNLVQYGSSKIYGVNNLVAFVDNITDDPAFLNPSQGIGIQHVGYAANWSVSGSSPVLNGGKATTVFTNIDFAGNSRIVADTVDIGAYEIQISNRFIDLQPSTSTVCEGAGMSFTTHAIVMANYQWQHNGVDIPGATSFNYQIPLVSLADTGTYNCIIANSYGSISTDTVEAFVELSPTITSSPSSLSECIGSSVTFTASASGSSPLSYQWFNTNGQLQSGSSAQSFQIGSGSASNTGNAYPTPFANYYWGTRQQYLYLASELISEGVQAGDISSLAFLVTAANSCPTLSDFHIKIGTTSSNSVSSSWVSGLTTVYSVSSYMPSSGWNNFGFQTPFAWDGTSNIIIEICSNNSSYINNGNASVQYSTTAYNSSHAIYIDAQNVCSSSSIGQLYAKRPDIKIVAGSNSNLSSYTINSISSNDASNYYMIATNNCGAAQSTGATLSLKYTPSLTPISAADDICEDNSYTYSTTTSQGTLPITYQWYKSGAAINSANSLTYNITSATTSDEGIYYCKAENVCGSDSTNQSVLVVNEKPEISSQSSSIQVCENQSINLWVNATGTAPISYQWYKGSNAISGATGSSYSINSVTSSDAATYYCKVANGCVSTPVSSAGIVVTVQTLPTISSQTGSVEVCSGTPAVFSLTASGTSPLTYQWYNSTGSISSATNNSYTISSSSTSDVGNYYCVITNVCGNASSNQIPLTVNSAPTFSVQPQSLSKCSGQAALFDVQVTGTTPITYQWYKGGVSMSGVSGSSYLISPVSTTDAANYYCIATNSCGNATSSTASLTVNSGVSISAQSTAQNLCEGNSQLLQITASGTTPISYQWYDENGVITGAVSASYSLSNVDTSDAGTYYCQVSNLCSNTNSSDILVTVNTSPTIDNQPSNASVCENLSSVFNVSASGTAPLSYQWFDGSGIISGATSSTYIIPQTTSSDVGTYYVKVSNSCGYINSNTASLSVKNNVAITAQSSSTSVCEGASPILSVTSTGSNPIYYQWYKNNSAISGATNNTLSIASADSLDDAIYYVSVSNSCNSLQSNDIDLTVKQYPTILSQPISKSVCEDLSAVFSISASGTAPLSYQWYKDNSLISGATSTSYLLTQVDTSDAGSYYMKVSNSCSTLSSNPAQLTVNQKVSIVSQSGSQTVCEGSSPSFSISTSGSTPITYQWYKDQTSVSGANNNSLTISSAATTDAGTYSVTASNGCNSASSASMILTINSSPTIISQPTSSVSCVGAPVIFSVNATGSAPLAYQWYKSGVSISGATSSSYQLSSCSTSDAGTYYVKVTNSCGNVTSQNATLTVNEPVIISASSGNLTKCSGNSAAFSVSASGSSPINYQWYFDGVAISGATSSTFNILQVDSNNAGDYYCMVSNSCNTAQSSTRSLTVNYAPSISQQSSGLTVCEGANASLSVTGIGSGTLSYQWYKDAALMTGSSNSTLSLYQMDSSDVGSYYCTVSNSCGSVNSNLVNVVVNEAPSFIAQSSSQDFCENAAMILTATATGTATISYQWKIDNQNITGAVNSTYSVSAVDSSDAGTYTCVATNLCGSVLSTPIVVGINQSPTISSQSAGAIKCVGSAFSFSVNASGTAPLQYQWYKNASAINGAINNLYILNSVDTSDAGTYYCVISNGCGSVTSTDKVLSIKQAPAFVSQSNSATKCEGESMLFSVSVSGSSPLNYQWYSDTGQVYGANANSYTLSNILTSNAGNYYCTVSNSCGSIVSTPKTLTVRTAPSILSQSNSDTLCQGESMLFNMNVNGSMPISYQWYKNQNSIVGALNNIYMIPSVDTIHAGIYHAVATNSCGSVQTSNINLLINKIVQISSQSGDSSRCEGESVQLSVSAAGTTPISYQWYKSGIAQIGLNSPQIALANLSGADAGSYYCNVANICNSVNSSSKTIIVHANPQIDLGIDTTFCLGGQVVLSPGFGFNCLWSNGSFNNQITVTQTGDYWVNATNQYGCQGNSDTINVNVVLPYAGADICMAGVDSATQKNVVVWEKTPNVGISSYNIYRESSVTGVWNLIENKPFDSLGVVFDMTSNPVAHADRYAISVIDSCGNESAISTPHKTMHLAVSQAVPSGYNLLWNGYQGFQVASYRIWRADTTQVWTLVDSVNGNIFMWHDTISAQIPLWYQVEVIRPGGPCNPTKANTNYNTTRSNQATNGFQAPNTLAANFIATPTHGQAPLVVMFFDQTVGNPTGWYWNFGDGTTSTQQNPAHQYDSIGIYDVTLTVTNNDGVNSYTKFGYIDVVPDGIGSYEEQFAINVFPNPFKDDVNIVYELNYQSDVVLEVFNTMGQRVFFIPTSKYNPGKYNVSFSAQKSTFGEGLYYLRITINDKVVSKKLVQIK